MSLKKLSMKKVNKKMGRYLLGILPQPPWFSLSSDPSRIAESNPASCSKSESSAHEKSCIFRTPPLLTSVFVTFDSG